MAGHVREESWERVEVSFFRFCPYALLALPILVTLLQPAPSNLDRLITIGIAVLAAAWMYLLDTRSPNWHHEDRELSVVYFVGLMVLVAVLILRASWFGVFGLTAYIRVFNCLSGMWPFVGVGINALLMALSQLGGWPGVLAAGWPSFLVLYAVNLGLAEAFSYFGWRTLRRDRERKQALADLAAALEENKGLHAQLLAQAREAGVLDERQRMAREIHDTLAQGLTGIVTQLEAAAQNPEAWQR